MEDGKKIRRMISQGVRYCLLAWAGIFSGTMVAQTQKVVFSRDFSPAEVLARLDCLDFPFFSAVPRMLGTSVPEAALRLYAHYCRTARAARRSCMVILLAHWNGKNENTASCLSMYRNAVQLCADVLKTVSELATG